MSTVSDSRPRLTWFRAKHLIFTAIVLMMGYVAVHNESFLVDGADAEWQHIESFKWWLLFHGSAGACALLLIVSARPHRPAPVGRTRVVWGITRGWAVSSHWDRSMGWDKAKACFAEHKCAICGREIRLGHGVA